MAKETFLQKKSGGDSTNRQNTVWSDIVAKCKHKWQPLSFAFEIQLLDKEGRVLIRQPDMTDARVYCVCMKCCAYTYIYAGWAGFYIDSPDLLEEEEIKRRTIENGSDDIESKK